MKWLIALGWSCCLTFALADTKPATTTAVEHSMREESPLACGGYCDQKPEPPLACGDYLKQLSRDRSELRYMGCKPVAMGAPPVPGFQASYRVKGTNLDKVDNWLATWAKWKRLRFSCCQWDAPTGSYRDNGGSDYYIDMSVNAYVDDHMVDRRKDFAKLPYATLTITHYLYSP